MCSTVGSLDRFKGDGVGYIGFNKSNIRHKEFRPPPLHVCVSLLCSPPPMDSETGGLDSSG